MMSARENLAAIIALVDAVDNQLVTFGTKFGMSTGPVHPDIKELREEIVERGKGYGILPESTSVAEIRHEGTKFDVRVGFGGKWPYEGLEWRHGALALKATERLEEKEDLHEPEQWLEDDPLYHVEKARRKHLPQMHIFLEEGDVDMGRKEAADALNHILMALDAQERGDQGALDVD